MGLWRCWLGLGDAGCLAIHEPESKFPNRFIQGTTTGLSKGDSGSLDCSSHKVCGLGVGATCEMLICFCVFVFVPCPKRHLVVKLKQPLKGLARPHEIMRGELYDFIWHLSYEPSGAYRKPWLLFMWRFVVMFPPKLVFSPHP